MATELLPPGYRKYERLQRLRSTNGREAFFGFYLVSAHSEGREPDAEPDRPAGPETQGSVASRWLVIAAITSGMSG